MTGSSASRVLIVGGGIVGLACAHELAEAGYAVHVIDRGVIGGGASHANCGYVCPSHVLPLNEPGAVQEGLASILRPNAPLRIKPQLRLGLYRWFFEFARRCRHDRMVDAGRRLQPLLDSSMERYRSLFAAHPGMGEWKDDGLAYVFRTPQRFDAFARTDDLLAQEYGIRAERFDADRLEDLDPALRSDLAGGYLYADDGTVRPDVLLRDWRELLEARGVVMAEECALRSVHRRDGRVSAVETEQGTIEADHFVFAVGAWSAQLAGEIGCRLPIEPGKGYSLTVRRPADGPRRSMLFPEHRIGVTSFADSFRIGSMMEFVGFDASLPEARMRQLMESARPYFRVSLDEPVEERWFGWRPMTWDGLPAIGRVPGVANGFVATGHNMLGLSLAPGTGRLIRELIDESTPHLPIDAFSPERF